MRPAHSAGVYRVLKNAQGAAGRYRHRFVHTEHLLLGLLEERNSATQLLKSLGQDRRRLLAACEARCERGHHRPEQNFKFTPRSQKILVFASEAAEAMGHRTLDSRHLLLGVVMEAEGIAGQTLRDAGVTEAAVRKAILAPDGDETEQNESAQTASSRPSSEPFWRRWLRA